MVDDLGLGQILKWSGARQAVLNARGFVEGNHGEPAQFVVEKAFAER